jgi:glycine/D-amino acid oxidase-like deaminating enzyme
VHSWWIVLAATFTLSYRAIRVARRRNVMLSRRSMLRQSLFAAVAVASGCAGRATVATRRAPRRFAKVLVSPDRVIRSIAGLRPFRPSGFVVRADRLGERTVIHNYGHGGGGISLSWGSSMLSTELATATGEKRFAVIGAGVMGLTTARLLQDRGFEATIYAKDLPPDTTSNIAGGQWSPYTVSDENRTTPEYEKQFERAARFANRYFQNQVGPTYGVRWIENYVLSERPFPTGQQDAIDDLYYGTAVLSPGDHPFAARHVRRFTTLLVEPAIFLDALARDYLLRGGKIHVREFRSKDELMTLGERVIVNCSGLGSRALFGDEELVPIKGQLAVLLPQPEVDYIVLAADGYMFPRSDGILLGGTRDRGEWSLTADPAVTARMIERHRRIFDGMSA